MLCPPKNRPTSIISGEVRLIEITGPDLEKKKYSLEGKKKGDFDRHFQEKLESEKTSYRPK